VVRGKDRRNHQLHITADWNHHVLGVPCDATAVQNRMKRSFQDCFNKQHKVLSKKPQEAFGMRSMDTGDNRQGVPHYAMGDMEMDCFKFTSHPVRGAIVVISRRTTNRES
jgi:hypothetical protein